jgi:hypothetical protein
VTTPLDPDAWEDLPHDFTSENMEDPNCVWCVCGRIREIGGYSPVHIDTFDNERKDV